MSLLSGLLDHMPPTNSGAAKPTTVNRTTDRPRLVLVELPAQLPASTYTNAANATPEWRNARDQYLNHAMGGKVAMHPPHAIARLALTCALPMTAPLWSNHDETGRFSCKTKTAGFR